MLRDATARAIWKLIWNWKTRLVIVWIVVVGLVVIRLLTGPVLFTSSCLMTPKPLEMVEGAGGGGLRTPTVTSLLGGGGVRDDYAVAAFLKSRQLTDRVIDELDLKKEFFRKNWDAEEEKWRSTEPTDSEARERMVRRLDVSYDDFTGLLLLEVHWTSPVRAREIALAYVEIGDRTLRESAIVDGERRIAELEREMANATVSDVEAYLAEELTRSVSLLTSIRARADYAYRVIDPPIVPDEKSWPPRTLITILVAFVTAAVEFGVVAGIYLRGGRPDPAEPSFTEAGGGGRV